MESFKICIAIVIVLIIMLGAYYYFYKGETAVAGRMKKLKSSNRKYGVVPMKQ